ncbi:MBL fold metallo-hydrolase [Pseudaestuariivita rosea]|uniref:MBL fold metallo-hydrolase n=1 Tax=Pseudaestuariivita rosea TaxID=2763263 RepID=UPI001ABBCA25|nr:MBL fold metallo-hydrolase [Pseudaestuariivita rosea]
MKRRDFLITAPAFTAGTLTLGAAPSILRAQTAGGVTQVTAAQRFRLGEMMITALSDGYLQFGPDLLQGIDAAGFNDLVQQAYRDPANYLGAVNAFAVETGDELWLIDVGTGVGIFETLGVLPVNLAAAGYTPDQVTRILATHLHPDHIGGAVADGAALFPNAVLHVAEADRAFWTDTTIRDQSPEGIRGFFDLAMAAVGLYQDRTQVFEGEADLVSGVTSVPLPGHTPGHMGFMLESAGESLLVVGDILHVPAIQLARPDVTIAFDVNQDAARASRMDLFGRVADTGQMIAGMHLPFPGIGYIETAGEGYRWVPAGWQYF